MKKNLILKLLVPALMLGVTTTVLRADEPSPSDKSTAQHQEVKKLTPQERAAKRKEAREKMEKRLAELQKKKAAGTITDKEQKQLDRLEAMKKNQGNAQGQRPPRRKAQEDKSAGTEKN